MLTVSFSTFYCNFMETCFWRKNIFGDCKAVYRTILRLTDATIFLYSDSQMLPFAFEINKKICEIHLSIFVSIKC